MWRCNCLMVSVLNSKTCVRDGLKNQHFVSRTLKKSDLDDLLT